MIDRDDPDSLGFAHNRVPLERVVVEPGLTMGSLNMAGYRAASGCYLMLLNDDVIVRTPAWDQAVLSAFGAFSDGILLVNANDLVFRNSLTIFPCVTREFCALMNGICPESYRRYCIDDHIQDIFHLLRAKGHRRHFFLPEVIFEHTNISDSGEGGVHYATDAAIHQQDIQLFHELAGERNRIAEEASRRIESRFRGVSFSAHGGIHSAGFSRANPLAHFLDVGAFEGRRPNPLFDPVYYLAENPEVAAAETNPLAHFVETGAKQGRRPNPYFDTALYRRRHPDVIWSGANPVSHYLERGLPAVESGEHDPRGPLRSARPRSSSGLPLSVVIPTHNRASLLIPTLKACARYAGDCDLEILVIDDGSTDDTAKDLQDLSVTMQNLKWRSISTAGPAQARLMGAAAAQHEVVLFLGDDIRPRSTDFFRVHATVHDWYPDEKLAVVGRVAWAFESSGRAAGACGWPFLYTGNASIRKAFVHNWISEGFDPNLTGAPYQELEFACRLCRPEPGLAVYFDRVAEAVEATPDGISALMERLTSAGRALTPLMKKHPGISANFRRLFEALDEPAGPAASAPTDHRATITAWQNYARKLEQQGSIGEEPWHASFLRAVLDVCLLEGLISAWPQPKVNLAAGWDLLAEHVSQLAGPGFPHLLP